MSDPAQLAAELASSERRYAQLVAELHDTDNARLLSILLRHAEEMEMAGLAATWTLRLATISATAQVKESIPQL